MVSFFTQGTQQAEVTQKDLLRHPFRNARQFFLAFAMRLTAARRMLYAGAVLLFVDRADRRPHARSRGAHVGHRHRQAAAWRSA